MPEYNVCYGVYVRAYGSAEFKARNDKAARREAIRFFKERGESLFFEDHDWNNFALPSIVELRRTNKNGSEEDVIQGEDFAANASDARDLYAEAMMNLLKEIAHGESDLEHLRIRAREILKWIKDAEAGKKVKP